MFYQTVINEGHELPNHTFNVGSHVPKQYI
jgi:hypothetical protein